MLWLADNDKGSPIARMRKWDRVIVGKRWQHRSFIPIEHTLYQRLYFVAMLHPQQQLCLV